MSINKAEKKTFLQESKHVTFYNTNEKERRNSSSSFQTSLEEAFSSLSELRTRGCSTITTAELLGAEGRVRTLLRYLTITQELVLVSEDAI